MESLALMPKYEDYVDSGVEWLGDIPASWSLLANKHIFRLKKKQVGKRSNEYDLLSLTLRGVIKRDMENPEGKFPAEFDTYQEVQCGDFIFCLFDVEETPRTVGLSPFNGMITGAYTVFEPNDNFDNRFLYYFYLNLDAKKRLKPLYRGLRNTIPKDSFLSFKTFVPPHEQQTRIANFLDKKTAQIDDAIAIKEQQISLLKERKQIIIQQAVTLGLDPNVPMKDSGVDWIGKIPAHWDIAPLKRLLAEPLKYGANESGYDYHPELPRYIRITDFSGEGKLNDEKKLSLPWEIAKDYLLKDGDILLARSGATVGKSYQFKTSMSEDTNYCFAGYLIKATHDPVKITSEFLNLFLNSDCFQAWKALIFNKATIENIGADKYSVLPVIVPKIEEQNEIFNKVCDLSEPIDGAIAITFDQIEKLKEYKTSLINSAVTGKIKITPEMVEQ
ncbi:restriction endonuclease subunit S [Shewanella xiamenensis]|uniref:restriction endonuclease subunit S n=1 Tax=Shewanella xiamenensis TaxID=332186 RepID=UPI0009B7884E|nr:restriction endonuclease subunit S [Shewanella xiamenensis]MEE1982440.1 restriction endonuclease subunit S [Shewanella xiamenensis]PHY62790.1 restriction endonuclease subunit S [Shewanella xiamenensis]